MPQEDPFDALTKKDPFGALTGAQAPPEPVGAPPEPDRGPGGEEVQYVLPGPQGPVERTWRLAEPTPGAVPSGDLPSPYQPIGDPVSVPDIKGSDGPAPDFLTVLDLVSRPFEAAGAVGVGLLGSASHGSAMKYQLSRAGDILSGDRESRPSLAPNEELWLSMASPELPILAGSRILRAAGTGRSLTTAERLAVMELPEAATGGRVVRVTPEGAVTVRTAKGSIDTTVQQMILDAQAKFRDPSLPPMDAIQRVETALPRMKALGEVLDPSLAGGVSGSFARAAAWLSYGRRGYIGGKDFAKIVEDARGKLGNIPGLAESEAAAVRNAFKSVSENPGPALEAVYDNLFFGTPVPETVRAEYGAAFPALRRSLSDLAEIHAKLRSIDPEVIKEYPVWLQRVWQDARKGEQLAPRSSPIPGLPSVHMRQDGYALEVSNLSVSEAKEILEEMPAELRPIQPSAPGASKGLLVGSDPPEWVGEAFGQHGKVELKWPDTPDGKRGRAEFRRLLETQADEATPSLTAQREMEFVESDPVRRVLGDDDTTRYLTTKDAELIPEELPAVLKRSWGEVLRRRVAEDFFASMRGMKDSANGEDLTKFITTKEMRKGQAAPEGYVFLRKEGRPDKRFGVLAGDRVGGVHGEWAVRKDVADYILNSEKASSRVADTFHGLLDEWAINATNAPKTGLMNWLYNKVVVDAMNGNLPWSATMGRARATVREWERTGEMPELLKKAAREGLPLRAPEVGFASIDEEAATVLKEASESPGAYEKGRALYGVLGASPLAKSPVGAAAGGAAQGGLRALAEGASIGEAVIETVGGALAPTVLRKPAQRVRLLYVNSDLFTTAGAFYRHFDDAIARGLTEDAAVKAAVAKTMDLTQAGLWHRLGGVSETFGAAPTGVYGAERTGVRALQKAFLNRFMKFHEVDVRLKMNAIRHGWKTTAGAALGGASIYGLRNGGKWAIESMGIMSEDELKTADAMLPDAVHIPVYDYKERHWSAVSFPGKSVGAPVVDYPTSGRELANLPLGPAFSTLSELVQGEDSRSVFTGAPLARVEPQEGEVEEFPEAVVRSNQERWLSPYAFHGRLTATTRGQVEDMIESPEDRTVGGISETLASVGLGPVRPVVPEELRERAVSAYFARLKRIELTASRGERRAVPSMKGASEDTALAKKADLAEEYLGMGVPQESLSLEASVRRLLEERGVLEPR